MSGTDLLDRPLDSSTMPYGPLSTDFPTQLGPQTLEEMLDQAVREEAERKAATVVHQSSFAPTDPSPVDLRELVVATASYGIDVACQIISLAAALTPFPSLGRPFVARIIRRGQ